MMQIEASTTINRPIEEVFAFVADNENDPQWCIPVVRTTRVVGDAPGANTRYTFASKFGLMTLRGEFTIVDFQPPERIAWKGTSPLSRYQGFYTLKAVEVGTQITSNTSFTNKSVFRLFESMMRKQFKETYDKQFRKLKQVLEG